MDGWGGASFTPGAMLAGLFRCPLLPKVVQCIRSGTLLVIWAGSQQNSLSRSYLNSDALLESPIYLGSE